MRLADVLSERQAFDRVRGTLEAIEYARTHPRLGPWRHEMPPDPMLEAIGTAGDHAMRGDWGDEWWDAEAFLAELRAAGYRVVPIASPDTPV